MTEWITDRQPTEADGDKDGDVFVKFRPNIEIPSLLHWSYVGPGVPWDHCCDWPLTTPVAEPATTVPQPRRFVSISRTVLGNEDHILDAIADDGTAWFLRTNVCSRWRPMAPLPAREVPADA